MSELHKELSNEKQRGPYCVRGRGCILSAFGELTALHLPNLRRFLRKRISELHKELSDEKQRWSREGIVVGAVQAVLFDQRILLLEEILLLVDRTLDPSLRDTTIPYKHT